MRWPLRIKSLALAALIGALLTPVFAWYLDIPDPYRFATLAMALLILIRHHSNIRNMLSGAEGKIGQP